MVNVKDFEGTYVLDTAHSEISFIARHAMVTKVRGNFKNFESSIVVDGDKGYTINTIIETASVDTGNSDRDGHILGEDFFDVKNFPEIVFTASSSDLNLDNEQLQGEITIKGVTKTITLDVEIFGIETDNFGNERLGFEASTTINRKDFNIDWNAPLPTGGVLVSEKIKIQIDGSAIKQ